MTQKITHIYRHPPQARDEFERRLAQLEREGVITPAQHEFQLKNHRHITQQQQLYFKAKATLLPRYEGQYIAFEDGVVLDSDPVFAALTQRLRAQFPGRTPLITPVYAEETPAFMGSSF